MENIAGKALAYSVYLAPRGRMRLLNLGQQLAQRYLSPLDKLIGFIGDSGAGKSLLIKGMFPGLELTNDDDGINVRPLPLLKNIDRGFFSSHTYHLDVRFESAFNQMHTLVDAVKQAIDKGKRVIIEHFDLIYPMLGINAEILIGIGEEVIVTRPTVFSPLPKDVADIVFDSIRYRKMAHTAEDITNKVLEEEFGLKYSPLHSDVRHGFVLEFFEKPEFDIQQIENKVKEYIDKRIPICYLDEEHIRIGDEKEIRCTGPRIHISNTGDIENFQLIKQYSYNPITKLYALVGIVGNEKTLNLENATEWSLPDFH